MFPMPNISGNRIKLKPSGYLKAGIAAVIIISAIVLYAFEFDHFDKILNIPYFLLLSLALGILLGILIGRRVTADEYELYEQMRLYMVCIVLCVFFMPLVVSLLNKHLDFRTPENKQAQIIAFRPSANQPFGHIKGEEIQITRYDFALLMEENIYKFSTKELPFPDNKMGDMIQVPIYQGLLGIRYLKF